MKAGIDPHGIPEMFQILLDERQSNPGALDAFFATHPIEEDRIAATQALIARYPASQLRGLTKDTREFQSFRSQAQGAPSVADTERQLRLPVAGARDGRRQLRGARRVSRLGAHRPA